MKHTAVYGAGLAGMTAAINLARAGYAVTVYDREKGIGGSGEVHPSVHTTPLQPAETWEYTGIDLSECFIETEEHPAWWYNDRRLVLPPYVKNLKSYSVERGARKSSIDTKLYSIAVQEGVRFVFGRNAGVKELTEAPPGSIISTGLYKEMYEMVGVDYLRTYGYMAARPSEAGRSVTDVYLGSFSVDYGYVSVANGLTYALLFSRKPLGTADLEKFKKALKKTRDLEFDNWRPFLGYFPRETKLYWNGKILAGTLCGMIEPFWGYGIVGALLSGRVAALAHLDRARAEADFNGFTRSFTRKLARKEKLDNLPFNKQLLRLGILKARFDCWRRPELAGAVKEPVRWFR